ncbi:MAG TPA: biotin--[acetyl-CoA-carboxylase] ligase [Pirellulales bacterium]|nr:biotin--[acetyl-CoA-carboxylase] ligase [Pirellulales bacterium]
MLDTQALLANTFLAYAEHHPLLDSTQSRARAVAEEEAAGKRALPALIVADVQTAGRGRANNRWYTGEGSLAFSLLVDPAQFGFERRKVPRLSLAAGVAIVDALAGRLAEHSLGLHWPNDVFVRDKKLAGILVEVLPSGRHIIGVGLNTNNSSDDAPPELRNSIATLRDLTGRLHDHTELLLAILENLEAALVQLSQPLETLGQRFDLLCLQRGETLTVYQGQQTITGRCVGIAPDGALLLDTPDGRREITSGTLRPPADW